MKKTKYYSYVSRKLPKGCSYCVKGEKLVLFVTGVCPAHCYFCPLSEQKKNKDVVFADEWKLKDENDTISLITEAKLINAKGAGITGGDPLARLQRTIRYIKLLKKVFGKKFHIHLYTPLNLVDEKRLTRLFQAGLDEIRFHPNLTDEKFWSRIKIAKKFKWDIGIEIPVIPEMEKEIVKLIEFSKNHIDFLNLNELEYSDTNADELLKRNLHTEKGRYSIKGSSRLAKKLLKKYEKGKLNIHYCTIKLKDKVQLSTRIKRRAKNVKKAYDFADKEGMLIRAALYTENLMPGFSYRKKLESLSQKERIEILAKLEKAKKELKKEFNIPEKLIGIDDKKLRILTSPEVALRLKNELKQKKLIAAIVKEYPTWDQTEIEVEFQ